MNGKQKIIISVFAAFFLVATCLNDIALGDSEETSDKIMNTGFTGIPSAIVASDSNPFYTLIATPLAISYNELGEQRVIPLFIKDLDEPSKAVIRAEEQIGKSSNVFEISDSLSPKDTSLFVAAEFWESSSSVLILREDDEGYNLGVVAAPLAAYLNMPIIINDNDTIDPDVHDVLKKLNVTDLYLCGNFSNMIVSSMMKVTKFNTVEEIIDYCLEVIKNRFGHAIDYITIANPLDVTYPNVIETTIEQFNGTVSSSIVLPTQFVNQIVKGNTVSLHEFTIPADYKYVQLKIDLASISSEFAGSLGDRMFMTIDSPDGERYVYASTGGGLPVRDTSGKITTDRLHFETTIYDKPGTYTIQVLGQFFALKEGEYDLVITLDRLDSPIVPLMPDLSSMAPYLTAYHKGIIFANTSFAFAADDHVKYKGSTCPGSSQPGTNPNLLEPSNTHTMQIHDKLNILLGKIANISVDNLEQLRNHYKDNPIYIAITADPTMVPMYFYKNPDGKPEDPVHIMGFAVPSDFIYTDIDPDPSDPENNTFSYWPFMENIVGRVTGQNVQDCSALIARTVFYDEIIDDLGDWKDNALVQTGCGLEFQNLPIATRLSHILYAGRDEPTKFPTGESTFINRRLRDDMATGDFNVKNTMGLTSQREGFSREDLNEIKKAGLMNRLLFPKTIIKLLNSDKKVTGGQDQLDSNLIFTFAHGFYNLYEAGDVFIDSRGFPFLTPLSRIYPYIRSSLSNKGSFDIRSVENMEYGPSVIFVESCITGRTDGINGENLLSQIYLHAGVNAFIGATRVTADPGYLEPRPLPGGWGIGILGLLKAVINYRLKDEYPDLHFGAVIAEDFIFSLIEEDATTGLALRNAKNMYLEKDANSTFLWTPPLSISTGNPIIDEEIKSLTENNDDGLFGNSRTRTLGKKYVALHEFQLYGDPAFNPYQPINNG